MFNKKKIFIALSLLVMAIVGILAAAPFTTTTCAAGQCREKANGSGTLVMNGVRRQFSFSAIGNGDGTARGTANIHNPNFPPDPKFRGNIEVRCLAVMGNRARIAGTVRNTNDPNLDNRTAVFEVDDNGNPGKDRDTITLVSFPGGDPMPEPTAAFCQEFGVSLTDPQQRLIENGNVHVDDCP